MLGNQETGSIERAIDLCGMANGKTESSSNSRVSLSVLIHVCQQSNVGLNTLICWHLSKDSRSES